MNMIMMMKQHTFMDRQEVLFISVLGITNKGLQQESPPAKHAKEEGPVRDIFGPNSKLAF